MPRLHGVHAHVAGDVPQHCTSEAMEERMGSQYTHQRAAVVIIHHLHVRKKTQERIKWER